MDSTISSKMRCARRCGARARLSFSEPCLLYTFRPLYQFERLSWCASGALLSLPSTFRSVFTRKRKITLELKFERHGEGPFCLILETRACPPMLSSVSSRQRTPIGEVRPPPFYSGRYCAHGLAAESRGAQCGMRQKGPASDLEKQQKRDNLTQERRVNAFLLKKVILLKKLIRTNI